MEAEREGGEGHPLPDPPWRRRPRTRIVVSKEPGMSENDYWDKVDHVIRHLFEGCEPRNLPPWRKGA